MKNKEFEAKFDKIVRGLELSYERLIEFKKSKNSPIIFERDGKILEIDPHTIPLRKERRA